MEACLVGYKAVVVPVVEKAVEQGVVDLVVLVAETLEVVV